MSLDFNFNFNLKDVTLGKLYKDANNTTKTDLSYNKDVTISNYSNNVNKYGGLTNSTTETLDLSSVTSNSKDNDINYSYDFKSDITKVSKDKDYSQTNINIDNEKNQKLNQKSNVENPVSSSSNLGVNKKNNKQSTLLEKEEQKNNAISSKRYDKNKTYDSNDTSNATTTVKNNSDNNLNNNTFSGANNKNDEKKEFFDYVNNDKFNMDISKDDIVVNKIEETKVESEKNNDILRMNLNDYVYTLSLYGLRETDIYRIVDGEISLEDLFIEIQKDSDISRRKEMLEATYLRQYNLEFSNVSELENTISQKQSELDELIEKKEKINSKEIDAMIDIVDKLKSGESLDSILKNTTVAWKYEDSNGDICYVYENPNLYNRWRIYGTHEFEELTFYDMYGESELMKKLKSVLVVNNKNGDKKEYIWNGTEEQLKFLNTIEKEYNEILDARKNDLGNIDEDISKLKSDILKYTQINNHIVSEIDYYFNNIDEYIIKDDFYQNCQFDENMVSKVDDFREKNISKIPKYRNSEKYVYIYDRDDLVNIIGCMINNKGDVSLKYTIGDQNYSLYAADPLFDYYCKWYSLLNEQEINVFNYIYNVNGTDAAYQFLQNISDELDKRWLENKRMEDSEYASKHPIMASIQSIFITPIEGMNAAFYSLNSLISGEKIKRTDVYSSGDVWRSQVSNDIAKNYGEGWAFLYNTGMSMADTTSMIGISALTGISAPFSATLMGSRAYVSTLNDALDRGLSDGQAVGLAFSAGVVETAMESYSLGHLMNLETKLGVKTSKLVSKVANNISNEQLSSIATKSTYIFSGAISQGLAEGEEEFATEILNFVLDDIISGELSNHTLTINNYISLGYTEEEARNLANLDFTNQLGQAFLGGFISGVCFGTFGGVKTTHNVSKSMAKDIETRYNGNVAKAFTEGIEINRILQENALNQYKENKKEQLLSLGNKIKNLFNQNQYNVKSNEHIQNIIYNINKAYSFASQSGSVEILISKAKGEQGKIAGVELFSMLGYDAKPTSISDKEFLKLSKESEYGVIVRGIAGPNSKEYANQLRNGEMYVGGEHAAIKGTGIYAGFGLKSREIGEKYSTRAGTEVNGEIVEMVLNSDANVVEYDTIVEEQNKVLDEMSKKYSKYSSNIKDFDTLFSNLDKITDANDLQEAKFITNFLSDIGYYAALNGYDAIVDSKVNYLTVLNRGKLYVKEKKVNVLNLNNEEVEVIKVDDLDTSINEFDRYAVNMNTTYIGYDYIVKPKGDLNTILEQIIKNNDGSKILIELTNINDITLEMLEKIPDNIIFRIIDYSMDFYQIFKKSRQNTVNAISEHLTYTINEIQLIIQEFNNIKKGIDENWNDYQKAQYVYDYMVNNIEYQKSSSIIGRHKHFDGLMSLVNKISTSNGFAHTYSAILNNIGIKCSIVWGNMNGEGNHAYNIVSIDGNNFIVDTTRESINKDKPGEFEGTGFGVQNIKQYSAVSNVDLFNKLNSTYDTIFQNLVQQNNYTNEINGTESVEELHDKLVSMINNEQEISLEFLENIAIEEIYDYILKNISEINILVQSKQIQEFIEKYYGEYPRQFTYTIINNLSRENITPKIINQILNFNDEQFNEFVNFNKNSVLFENEEIFNRAIATGINFIYELNDSIKLKMINNDDYINLIKNSTSDLSSVASQVPIEYLEIFLNRINFDQFEISEQFEILRNAKLPEDIQLKLINNEEYINYCKKIAKESVFKLSNIFSEYSTSNIELFLDKLNLESLSISLQFDIIDRIFYINPNIDAEFQRRIIEKSSIFSNPNLIKFYNLKNILEKIKDSKFVYDICNMESVFSMLNKNFYYITDIMKYLDTKDQIQFIENKGLLVEINSYDLNNLINSVSSDAVETLLSKYPKIQNYLNSTTFLEIYLKTNKNKYLLELKKLITNNKISSLYELRNIVSENNLFNIFTFEELDTIWGSSSLDLIVSNINKIEDVKYKEYFNNLLNRILNSKTSWTVNEAIAVSNIISFDAFSDIISQFDIIRYYDVKDNIDKLSAQQREVVFDKIKISDLLGYISNENVYNYVLEKFKNNPNILQDVDPNDMIRYTFTNDTENQRINELIGLINDNDKLKFVSSATIENEQFIAQMLNIVRNNHKLIINVPGNMISKFFNKFSLEDRISLYYKMSPKNLISVYSKKLSLDEQDILMKLIIKNFENINSYEIVELMEKMDSKSQVQLISNIDKFEMSTFSFSELLRNIQDSNVLGLIFQKFSFKYTLDNSNLGEFIAQMDSDVLNIFRQNCPDDILIRSFNILLSDDFETEILKRFDNNPRLFYSLPDDINLTNFKFLTEEHFNNYINNYIYDNIKNINYNEINLLFEDSTLKEKFNFIYAHQDGLITKEKFEFLLNLKQKNKYVLSTFNYNLFDDTIYQLGPNLLSKLSKYYDVVDQIVELKNTPEKFNLFANMIVSDSSSSVLVQDQKMAMILDYLLENDLDTNILNYSNMTDVEIARNIILKNIDLFSLLGVENTGRSIIKLEEYDISNYYEELSNKCDSLLDKATILEEVQNLIFNKYFSISIEDAQKVFKIYGNKFSNIKNLDTSGIATTYLENLYNILNASSMEEIIDLYNMFDTMYTMDDTLTIINEIKRIYTISLKNTLFTPKDIIDYVEYNGVKIPVYAPKGDFQMLVHSTAAYGKMTLINDNYFDSWNLSNRTANHGICCSLISNNNMGVAEINDVLLGFNSFTDEQINMMAPYDIYTANDGYLITSGRPLLYLPGQDVMNETRHTHNEFNLERTNLTGEGNLANIQPDYVIIFEDMDIELKTKAYKASIEFNIPLVYLNREILAINEKNKIDNLINEFNTTYNVKLLKDILVLHENNRSGYRVSKPDFVTKYFPSDKIIQILKDGIENVQSIEDLLYIKEILEEENAKFDATHEATNRTNIIDIPIKELLEKIDNKLNLLNNNSNNSINLENLDNQVELINKILEYDDEQFKNFINTNTNIDLYKNEKIFKRAMSTGMNFINRLSDITQSSKSFSDFSIDQLLEYEQYADICEQLFKLVDNIDSLLILKGILYDGAIGNYSIRTNINCKDSPDIEIIRRVSMAYLFLNNSETFKALVDNNINVFHGTNGNALPNIINYGMNSVSEAKRREIDVTTGETWSRISGERDFISFTDVLEIAEYYSFTTATNSNPELDFNVIIGTSTDKLLNIQRIGSDISEFGVGKHIDLEQIKCICVPNDKVEYVKKMLNNEQILVLGLSNLEGKFYGLDDNYYLDYDKSMFNDWIKNKFSSNSSGVKSLNTSNLDDIEQNVLGATSILNDEVNDIEFELKSEHEYDTVRLISIKELLNIIKNDNIYDEFTTHKYFNRNTKYLVSDITRDEYLEAFVQLYHAIKNNNYDLGLNFFQKLRLKKIYNFALNSLEISKIQYDPSLPNDIKLRIMFRNKKIYNSQDLNILYNYYNEKFSLGNLLKNPRLFVSEEYSFYLDVLTKYYEHNEQQLVEKDLTFWNNLVKNQMHLNDVILKNNIDLGEKGFNKFISNITFWSKEINDYVTYYGSIYGINIENLNYDSKMPNYLKLELMRRDKIVYDEDLLINKMDKVISSNVPSIIICDELYWLYYNTLSKYYNAGNNKYEDYYNMCEKIYRESLAYIVSNNVQLSEKQFMIFMRELGNNINIIKIQNYIASYLRKHSIDISKYLSKIIYKETLPKEIKLQLYQKILENTDWYLNDNSNINYGVNQNSVASYMRFRIDNLNWLDEENFKEYLINKHKYKAEDADGLLEKLKERVGKSINPRKGSLILEYIYEKCLSDNRFDVLDVVNNSFSFKFSDEFTRLALKLENLGINELDSLRILSAIDSTGCCSYASVLNGIFMAYRNNPSAFERDFGYPMYIDVNGNKELNSGELMLDVYTFINSNKCGGSLFIYEEGGTLKINDLITENQIYITTVHRNNDVYHKDDLINAFFKFKKANSKYVVDKSAYFGEGKVSGDHVMMIKEAVTNFLMKVPTGSVELGLWHTKNHEFRLLNNKKEVYKTTNSWSEGVGHAVCITGVLDKYFIISSWGKRLFVPIEDFINNEFNVIFRHMEGIE